MSEDLIQTDAPLATELSGHQNAEFEAKAQEIVNLWLPGDFKRFAELGEDRYIRAAISSALRSAVEAEREACAKVIEHHIHELNELPGNSPSSLRGEIFSLKRVLGRIRSRGAQVTAP